MALLKNISQKLKPLFIEVIFCKSLRRQLVIKTIFPYIETINCIKEKETTILRKTYNSALIFCKASDSTKLWDGLILASYTWFWERPINIFFKYSYPHISLWIVLLEPYFLNYFQELDGPSYQLRQPKLYLNLSVRFFKFFLAHTLLNY